jgi:hypothetical protein
MQTSIRRRTILSISVPNYHDQAGRALCMSEGRTLSICQSQPRTCVMHSHMQKNSMRASHMQSCKKSQMLKHGNDGIFKDACSCRFPSPPRPQLRPINTISVLLENQKQDQQTKSQVSPPHTYSQVSTCGSSTMCLDLSTCTQFL